MYHTLRAAAIVSVVGVLNRRTQCTSKSQKGNADALQKDNGAYDCIVIGLGGHGSATIAELSKRGQKVLGIEQFHRIHEKGSSHGKSRIYRQAYFEDPKYVPLLQRSLTLWKDLDAYYQKAASRTGFIAPYGTNILTLCGGLMIGIPDSQVVAGTLKSIRAFNLPHEVLSSAEVRARFPVFHLAKEEIGVYEENAGYLNPEACMDAYFHIAEGAGGKLQFNETFQSYTSTTDENGNGQSIITVTTNKGTYRTKKLVLAVGAWAAGVYGDSLKFPITLQRRVLFWFHPKYPKDNQTAKNPEDFKKIPVYIWDLGEEGNFYGFPELPAYPNEVKVAHHMRSDVRLMIEGAKPENINRNVEKFDVDELREPLKTRMPSLNGEIADSTTCMYTMTPDEHFLIDFHPTNKNVILASPCSGHGFKFCSVVGEIIADLVIDGKTTHDISIFSAASRDPTHKTINS